MQATDRSSRRLCFGLLFLLGSGLLPSPVQAQPRSCEGCFPDGESCTLEYGASGIVRDDATGLPIAGAVIDVLDLTTVSAADGSYAVRGTRLETCHLDYYWSLSASADGYEPAELAYYATDTLSANLELRLRPLVPPAGFTIQGTVAEFPSCDGRMRGVSVILEPLALTAETSVGPDGGRFEFLDVPPGEYALRVAPACNPFGCSKVTPVEVVGSFVQVDICMDELTPAGPPTPTQTRTPTELPCPQRTPCALGEKPREEGCTPDACGLGCGCETCPACPSGEVLASRFNACECVPDGVGADPTSTPTPTPTPTSTPCAIPTGPHCSLGFWRNCSDFSCFVDCRCEACEACPDGEVFVGPPDSCNCAPPPFLPTPTVCPACPTGTELAGPGCNCIVTDDENDPAAAIDANGSSSGGCAVDPQSPSGVELLFVVFLLLISARNRAVRAAAGTIEAPRPDISSNH